MFEKEAEEYANRFWGKKESLDRACTIDNFKDGAEFGYNKAKEEMQKNGLALQSDMDKTIEQNIALKKELNKANEWHYVKDGDYPKDDKQYLVLFFYNYKGKKEMSFGVRDNLHSDFEIKRCYTEQIIAWKEIVLPEGE